MSARRARPPFGLACLAALLTALLLPASASAHGIVGRADLPIPAWLFAWAATGVMVISFLALWSLWSEPRLQRPEGRVLLRIPRLLEWLCGLVGVALFAIVAYAGLAGEQNFTSNLAPTFIYVIFWVGIPIASAFVGGHLPRVQSMARARTTDRLASAGSGLPARAPARLLSRVVGALAGRGDAARLRVAELVYPSKDDPRLLAICCSPTAARNWRGWQPSAWRRGASEPTGSVCTSG